MSARVRGQPPGRAGRMWLGRRLSVALRGADLLEHKLRVLMAEEQQFRLLADRTARAWDEASRDLDRWVLRAGLLGGERALRLAGTGEPAAVQVVERVTMGVRYPVRAACSVPERSPSNAVADSTALLQAVAAAERAVQAGVDHAVAAAALAAVRGEIASTRQQVRAVRDRWIPRLEQARDTLATALDDQEHEDLVRLRWAADPTRRGGTR